MASHQSVIIVCPLAHEQALLQRHRLLRSAEVHCCGPGAAGIENWLASHASEQPVVLAGVAGALREGYTTGSAYIASRVVDADQHAWTPTWPSHDPPRGEARRYAIVGSSEQILSTPRAKAAFATLSAADLVDMESVAFARAAQAAGRPWGIVRGVSDDAATALPADASEWVDERGRTRLGRVAGSLLRQPGMVLDLLRLKRSSEAALAAVAACLSDLLEST